MENSQSQVQINIEEIIASAMNSLNLHTVVTPRVDTPDVTEERSEEEIPANQGSALVHEETSRFSGAIWADKIKEQTIILAGLGGIGSYVNFLLARLDPTRLITYDDDVVERGNMSGQLYGIQHVGTQKAYASSSIAAEFANYQKTVMFTEKYTDQSEVGPIMICGFDNMAARKTFYNKWKKYVTDNPSTADKCLFIDGRLAAESFQVLCITGTDTFNMEKYEKDYLFSDTEADATICSYKQTTFMANMIGSIMVNLFVNFIANMCNPLIPRDVPFYTEYTAETMFFKVIA